jgi:hypothetical protein
VAKAAPAQYQKEDRLFIKDHRITNRESFLETTKEPRQIAGLYFYQLLDPLVDLAYKVSGDFRKKPQLYRDLGKVAPTLAKLNAQYGTEVIFPSTDQRNDIYLPIFGQWDNSTKGPTDSFSSLRDELVKAAAAFAELAVDSSVQMLRENMRGVHRLFKDYVTGLHGDSVRFSKDNVLYELTEGNCYPILRSEKLASIYGIPLLPSASDYPYSTDSSADIFVEQITKQMLPVDAGMPHITRKQISNLQRAALRGAEAIATAIDFEEADPNQSDDDLDLLIKKCYTWGAALKNLRETQNSNPAVQTSNAPMRPAARVTGSVGLA